MTIRAFATSFGLLAHTSSLHPKAVITYHRSVAAWLAIVMLCLLGLSPSRVWATCSYVNGTTFVTVPVVLQGTITVGRDAPVGTELYRGYVHSSQQVAVNCDQVSPFNYQYISFPYPKASYTDPVFGNNVYQTNVPGVGVVAWAGNQQPMPVAFNSAIVGDTFVSNHAYYISLIKIGPVSAGTITGAALPTLQYVVGSNNLRVQLGGATGSVSVVARTCTTPDVTMDLGTHYTNELKGVGSTTASLVDASFTLENCPAFFGSGYVGSDNGTISSSQLKANSISYQLDPTTSILDATDAVFALAPGGAMGVGIQLLDGASNPVTYGMAQASGLVLNQIDGSNYTIPLQARYYQTGSNVTAGQANGAVTVTLIYN